jgi:phytol kinase
VSYSETKRQAVHIAMVGWAFLLRVLTWRQAAALAVVALLFNAFVLPRAGGRAIFRPDDVRRAIPAGILYYPLAVLLLILCFRHRLDIAAAAWAILAVGDGMATLLGRRFGRTPIAWNRDKTWEGTIAFMVCGGAAGVLLCWWTRPNVSVPVPMWFVGIAPLLAAAAAAMVETVRIRLDDNLSVPLPPAARCGSCRWRMARVPPRCCLVSADASCRPSS